MSVNGAPIKRMPCQQTAAHKRQSPAKGGAAFAKCARRSRKAKTPAHLSWGFAYGASGGVLLSHGECHTIIGAKAFHGPVRDGKAWDHLAMATRHKLSTNLKKLCTPDTVWNTELIRLGL